MRARFLAVLTVPALIFASQLYVGYHSQGLDVPFVAFLVLQLCHWYLWAAAGPLVWRLARRWPVTGPDRTRGIVRHAATAAAIAVAIIAVYLGIDEALRQVPALHGWFRAVPTSVRDNAIFFFVSFFHVELLVYTCILVLAHAVSSATALRDRDRDALRLTSALATARLQALRAQLQPHFLFNTLNTIGSLVLQRQNDRAVGMLAELGDLLRATLDRRDVDLVPLADEISQLRRYLRIEEVRFGDRLQVHWDLAAAANDAPVPAFILQPIVENAIRHGIAHRTDASRLDIRAAVDGNRIRIEVYNDGPQVARDWSLEAADGFGLRNVRERLLVRDPDAQVVLRNTGTSGVTVSLDLPRLGRE